MLRMGAPSRKETTETAIIDRGIQHAAYPAVLARLARLARVASIAERRARTDMDTIACDCGPMTRP
jgi:hypothetical protein